MLRVLTGLLQRPDPPAARVHPVIDSRRSSRGSRCCWCGPACSSMVAPALGGTLRADAGQGRRSRCCSRSACCRRSPCRARCQRRLRSALVVAREVGDRPGARASRCGRSSPAPSSPATSAATRSASPTARRSTRRAASATTCWRRSTGSLATLGVPRHQRAPRAAARAGRLVRRRCRSASATSTRRSLDVGARDAGAGLHRRRPPGGADHRRAADRRARGRPDLARRRRR